jgi:hypothetical protein
MTTKEVADLLFAARERIDFYWNFYVVVVIAVIGWLVSVKRPLTLPTRILVSIGYMVAAIMNLVGLHGSYTFAEALRTDLLRMTAATPLTDTRSVLERHSYLAQRAWAFWVHAAVGAAILLVVWLRGNRTTSPGPATAPSRAARRKNREETTDET